MSVQTTFNDAATVGYAGTFVGTGPKSVETMRNDEASAEIAFGIAVKHDSATDAMSAKLLTAITGEAVAGIVAHSHSYDQTQLGTTGVKKGALLNVVRKGRLLVVCEDGCSVNSPLHIRAVATGDELAGALLGAADGSDTIDCKAQGIWRTSAAAGGLAELEFDFSGFPTPA